MKKPGFKSILLYIGADKESFHRYRGELDRSNLKTLSDVCVILFATCLAAIVFYGATTQDIGKIAVLLAATALLSTILFLSRTMHQSQSTPNHIGVVTVLWFVRALSCLVCVYLGTARSNGGLAVMAIWMALFTQIVFDTPLIEGLCVQLPCMALFMLLSYKYKDILSFSNDCLHIVMSVTVGTLMSWHKSRTKLENIEKSEMLTRTNYALYHSSTTDELTNLPNRRQMFELFEKMLSERGDRRITCVLMDIDDFKFYNDNYGHPAGDKLLKRLGKYFNDFCQDNPGVTIGRIGGEEFMALLYTLDDEQPEYIARELVLGVETLNIENANSRVLPVVTLSGGIFTTDEEMTSSDIYNFSDRALYRAKGTGKNRFCIYEKETFTE